jgi:hypothetical protein
VVEWAVDSIREGRDEEELHEYRRKGIDHSA